MLVKDLKNLAKGFHIKGYSKMKKKRIRKMSSPRRSH